MARSAGRRAEILEVFVRHVAERGYDKANMADVANELGMSKGTIVHHFGTKAQMLRELEESHLSRQICTARAIWRRLAAPQDRIAGIIYAAVLMQALSPEATIASRREVVQLSDDPAMQEVRELRHELRALISAEIRKGIRAGVFRSVNAELATLQLWGSVEWMWVWFNPGGARTPEEIGASFVDLFLGGLLLDRLELKKWADPRGHIVKVAHDCFAEVADKAG